MESILVELGARSYPISIGFGLLDDTLSFALLENKQAVIITNTTIEPLYAPSLTQTLTKLNCQYDTLVLPDGEQYKTLDSFEHIISFLLENNYARDVVLIALGGGVIGDLVGFAAASYQRGVDFIQVPTTLLAQVDSSVGGKTAVNHPLGKNMIGAFYQPKAVIIDTNCLQTLPPRELSSGLAEVIKYGIIADDKFFNWLEMNIERLMQLDNKALSYAIRLCCQIKAHIVAQDETESGKRALLNLGHTFGHAIEAQMGYGNWLHGEAVASGIVIAMYVAYFLDDIDEALVLRVQHLLAQADLPIHPPKNMGFDDFMQHMVRDKKVLQQKIRFVIPNEIGGAKVTSDVDLKVIERAILASHN